MAIRYRLQWTNTGRSGASYNPLGLVSALAAVANRNTLEIFQ